METLGAALLIRESELKETSLAATVQSLLNDNEQRIAMEKAAEGFGFPDANRRIHQALLSLIREKK